MQGATVIEISLLIPPQPHDIETESEDPRPFEIRRASHLHDIFVKASAYLRLHKHTSAPIQMIEVEQITPDRVVLDMPSANPLGLSTAEEFASHLQNYGRAPDSPGGAGSASG